MNVLPGRLGAFTRNCSWVWGPPRRAFVSSGWPGWPQPAGGGQLGGPSWPPTHPLLQARARLGSSENVVRDETPRAEVVPPEPLAGTCCWPPQGPRPLFSHLRPCTPQRWPAEVLPALDPHVPSARVLANTASSPRRRLFLLEHGAVVLADSIHLFWVISNRTQVGVIQRKAEDAGVASGS